MSVLCFFFHGEIIIFQPNPSLNPQQKKAKKRKRPSTDDPSAPASSASKPAGTRAIGGGNGGVHKRLVKPRPKTAERRPYYDEADQAALRLMRKLRVDWTPKEDSFLLLCKVAGAYLCQVRPEKIHECLIPFSF